MSKISYEVLGYMTSSDFDGCNFTVLDEFITDKKEATDIGNGFLNEYYKVKVQSNDREFIEILGGETI